MHSAYMHNESKCSQQCTHWLAAQSASESRVPMGYILPSKRKSNFIDLLGMPNATCILDIYTPFFSGMSKWRNNISLINSTKPPGKKLSKKVKEFQSKVEIPKKKMSKHFEVYSAQLSCTRSDLTYVLYCSWNKVPHVKPNETKRIILHLFKSNNGSTVQFFVTDHQHHLCIIKSRFKCQVIIFAISN